MNHTPLQRMPLSIVLLGMCIPTIGTYCYFDLLSESAPTLQKLAYLMAKGSQVGILLAAIWMWRAFAAKQGSQANAVTDQVSTGSAWSTIPSRHTMIIGVVSGILIGTIIVGSYLSLWQPLGTMAAVKPMAQAKLQNLGANSPLVLIGIGIFYSVLHSGFEELYWRGFVFRGLREYLRLAPAMILSSLAFMSHHVIVLGKLFGYDSSVAYLFSLGVAIGGALWAFFYHRFGSLIPGWMSHAIVDAAIFVAGYLLLFG